MSINQKEVRPSMAITRPDNIEEIKRSIGIGRTEAEKIQDERIMVEFTLRLKKEGYSVGLIDDFAARMRMRRLPPNYIAGAITVLLSRRAEEAEREYTLERLIRLTENLSDNTGKKVAEELSKISLYTTSRTWTSVLFIDLSKVRSSGQLSGYWPEGADCVVYLPDSTGTATIHLDSPTAHAYAMGTIYRKVRHPFTSIYVENEEQDGCKLYLLISKGGIDVEAMEHAPADPLLYNVNMWQANREYSQTLLPNTKRYTIQTRDGTAFRMAYVPGVVAAPTFPYWTVPVNTSDSEVDIRPSQLTLYFACALADRIIEIKIWT